MPKDAKHLPKWKKGQSGNPKGRPPLSAEQKALRKLTIESFREVIEVSLTGTVEDLKAIAQNPNTPALHVGLATAILRSIKDGDPSVLERFAERIIGKVPEVLNINSVTKHSFGSKEEMEKEIERLRAIRKGT